MEQDASVEDDEVEDDEIVEIVFDFEIVKMVKEILLDDEVLEQPAKMLTVEDLPYVEDVNAVLIDTNKKID